MRNSPEFELIERVREALREAGVEPAPGVVGIGDDAAVTPGIDGVLVTSIDLCVEGTHFSDAFSDEQVGHKALAGALSDLAAMGARPREAYAGLVAPPGFDAGRAVAIAGGMGRLAATHGVAILGGDLAAGKQLALSITVIGEAPDAGALVTRSGASPGDAVLVSGELGGAAAGLAVISRPELANELSPAVAEALRARQHSPQPRLELGRALAAAGAGAMIDLSDGVRADSEQIASESGVAIELRADRLPIAEGVEAVAAAAGSDPLSLAGAGEDYELLVTFEPDAVEAALEAAAGVGEGLTVIGSVGEGSGVTVAGNGETLGRGFDHLARG
jgi:thiamine-monophosphate kinase